MTLPLDHLKHVFRRLLRTPLFSTITLITLVIGIGANGVVFGVVDGVLLKPLNYPHPEQLVGLWHSAPGIGFNGDLNMAPFIYFIEREQGSTFQDVGMYNGDSLSVTGVGQPEHVSGLDVTDGTLPILGVKPVLGRLFTRQDDSPNAPKTVILSHAYWQRKFGGDKTGAQDIRIGQPSVYGPNIVNADSHVIVLNAADLGFVRNQFIRCKPSCSAKNLIIFTYLENYPVAPFAAGGSNFGAGGSSFPHGPGHDGMGHIR